MRTSINEYREKKERVSYIYIYMNVFFYIYIVEDLNQCEVLKINLPSLLLKISMIAKISKISSETDQ